LIAVRKLGLTMHARLLRLSPSKLEGVLFAVALLIFGGSASRAGQLYLLSGTQIRTQFTGKVLTDGTHWRETYAPGGKLLVEEMGHAASPGSWRIDGDRLCKVRAGILDNCYEVWGGGDRIEIGLGYFPPLEAFLRSSGRI
jgi:hypothetical protein